MSGLEEHYGTEPPPDSAGWTYQGDGKWTRPKMPTTGGPRIAVVGGGPGGLFTSYIINQRIPSANVTIFESTPSCGGKVRTDSFSDGTQFEAGVAELYEYLGSTDRDPLRTLIEDDLGLDTVDISGGAVVLGDTILRDMDEVERVHGSATRQRIEAFHTKMVALMPLEKYTHRWQPDNDHPWAKDTFRHFIEEELGNDQAAIDYVETAVASDLATESHTCNGLNGIKNVLMDNDQYMQVYHVVGGIERVVEALIDEIDADIRTCTRVTGISQGKVGAGYSVSTIETDGGTLSEHTESFDAVIVAIPNHWLRNIEWEGSLKKAIHEVCAHYDLPAHYLRVTVLFDEKWWKKYKMPGEFWMMSMLNGCCCYDESTRWEKHIRGKRRARIERGVRQRKYESEQQGHILSFLIAGGDALLMCSSNQEDDCIVDYVLQSLPPSMRQLAEDHFVEGQVDRYVGSINAQPGGWPAEELRGEHRPEPQENPGVLLCGDYFFDSTMNAALMSAATAVDILLEYLGVDGEKATPAIEALVPDKTGL